MLFFCVSYPTYGALDELVRGCVELPRIENHWDEMMRASGSLKLGTIHASELVRSLLRSDVHVIGWFTHIFFSLEN